MFRAQCLAHPLGPGLVSVRLKGGRGEELLVSLKFKGIGGKGPALLPKPVGGNGSHHAGIQSPGEKGAQGHVGDELPLHRVQQQLPQVFHRLLVSLLMGLGFQVKVGELPEPQPVKDSHMAGL